MQTLKNAIASGAFIKTCELTPPKGTNLEPLFAMAEMLKDYIHAFNLTESHAARMAMDPVAAGYLLYSRGIEPIVQMTTRDKNRIALQSSMLGASALGVPNIVFMGGDPPKIGDHPEAKGVFDFFASQVLEAASALLSGTDYMGNKLDGTPQFSIGAVVNPGSPRLDEEITNMHRKVEAGASFLQTQAVFEVSKFEDFLEKAGSVEVPVLAGVIPVKSVKMAQYMNDRVPGIDVPDSIIQQIADCDDDKQKIVETSIGIAAEIVRELSSATGGVHLMAIGWQDKIPQILELANVE